MKKVCIVGAAGWVGRLFRAIDNNDQVEACRRVFASDTRWAVVCGSDLEEGEVRASRYGAGMWANPSRS